MSEREQAGWFLLAVVLLLGIVGTFDRKDQEDNARLTREIRATAPSWAVTR